MDQRSELREFLRSRRARLRPEELGLPGPGGRRRVAGLRREEVAQLAGISSDYYVRLEQGRTQHVSDSVLDAVADVLRMDDDERAHLRNLVSTKPTRRTSAAPAAGRSVRPALTRMVTDIDNGPAYLLDRAMNLLAWNRLAGLIFEAVTEKPAEARNMARFVFLDEAAKSVFIDWPEIARTTTAYLRLNTGRKPNDSQLTTLVGELSIKSEEFRRLWSEQLVADRSYGVKRMRHPLVGTLTLSYETLRQSDDSGQLVMVFNAEPGSETDDALRLLSSWGNDRQPADPATAVLGDPESAD
ncbi:MAG TPA: helix-turn-helix transcriptional regulator [Pseudonocardiaceae bacterium]|jgi:hypothetical protein|nr:helix-turn-helix transcriptional regulator [Pseudonocardiaceae bacterium]